MCKTTEQSSLGWHLDGGQGFVERRVKQEQCPAAAEIPCGDFAGRSLGIADHSGSLGSGSLQTPSTAVPGSSLHSWRQGCCWGLWALSLCAGRALVQPWTSVPTGCPGAKPALWTLWVAAAEIAEHILKWKRHLDKLTALGGLCFTLSLLWDRESHFASMLLLRNGVSVPSCCT